MRWASWRAAAWSALAIMLCIAVLVGCGGRAVVEAPVAAVMDAKGRVILVDLERGHVVETVSMRSWTGDIIADPKTGTFVTTQSGGVGSDADDAVGIIGVREDRKVRYVELPRPNPLGLEVARDGIVLVDHGWMEKRGMFACLVDIRGETVTKSGHVPDNNGPITVAGGHGWSPGVDVMTDRPSLRRVDLATMESTEVLGVQGRAFVECETPYGLAGWVRDEHGGDLLASFDSTTGALEATAAVELQDGPGRLVCCDGLLVALDFSGDQLDRPESRVLVFDSKTLKRVRVLELTGVPTDAAVWRDRVVIANIADRSLQVIDPATGRVDRVVRLPKVANLPLRVAVLDRRAR